MKEALRTVRKVRVAPICSSAGACFRRKGLMNKQAKSFWWVMASAAAMVLGAFGPWATVFGLVSVNGTAGDGWIVIVAAIVGAGVVFLRQRRSWNLVPILVAELAAIVGATTAIYHWIDF